MKKLFSLLMLAAMLVLSSNVFASVGVRVNNVTVGTATDLNFGCGSGTNASVTSDGSIYNIMCNSTLQQTGIANGGATSLATVDTGIPLTFAYVRKAISNLGTTTDPLANGTPGQVLTLFITAVTGGGTWTVTPTTATGVRTIAFNTAGQSVTLAYLNDTNGWVIMSVGSTGSSNDATITQP